MVFSSLIFLATLLLGSSWAIITAAAAAATFALVCLVAVQLSPLGRRQQRLAMLIAQTEAARRAIDHSINLWDSYLTPRMGELNPEELALAVESLAESGKVIIGDLRETQPRSNRKSEPAAASAPKRDNGLVDPAVAAKY
jgi:hypothetical protein